MSEIISFLFSDGGYSPHGYCLAWDRRLIFTHVFSDLLISFSYFAIPIALYYFFRRRRDFPYRSVLILFAVFIFACGVTHLFGVLTLWQPVYGLQAAVKLVTGIVSATTAILLWPLIPRILSMPSPAALAFANAALKREVGERRLGEERLKAQHDAAEAKLNQRTAEMTALNLDLAQKVARLQETEKELAETTAQFLDLADRTRTGIVHLTVDGVVVRATLHYAVLVGVDSPQELFGRNASEWIVEPNPEGLKAFRRAVLLGNTAPVEMRLRRTDGQIIDVEAVAASSHMGSEPVVIASVRDITQRKTLEREAAETRAQMARSNEDLERFASIASHDLNAPLRHLRIILESVMENAGRTLESESVGLLKQGYDATERMSTLIKDLLDFSRLGSIEANGESVKLGDVLRASIANVIHHVNASNAKIDVGDLPTVTGNAGALIHLWQNLLNNALRYRSEKRPEITVTASESGDGWEIAVTDNGIGVPPEQAERIFEMHTRLHSYKEIPGSGIGLAACRRVANLHGGRIWLDTAYTGGSRFVVWLPKELPARDAASGPAVAQRSQKRSA
jgi:PAS domain S-box-containing protein